MNYDIELNANDSSTLETQYAFTQGDYGQIQFSIRVKADGVYVTDAQRAYIVFTLPNGYVVTGADMSKSVATYTYPFQGSELQVPGIILADVKLVYTDGQISSNKFSFICRYDPLHDKSFEAGPYISQLQKIVDDGQAKIDYLQSLIEILQTNVGGTPVMRSDLHNTRDAVAAGTKAIDANMTQNILLKSDVTHQNENDANKIVAADLLYSTKANLQSQIDTTNSNLSNLTTDLTVNKTAFNVSNATSQANNLTSYGKIRIVDLSFRPSAILQSTQSYTLYTLSLGNRPSYIIDTFTINSLGHKHRIQINTSGEIKIYPFDDIAIGELILINMSFAV